MFAAVLLVALMVKYNSCKNRDISVVSKRLHVWIRLLIFLFWSLS